MHRNAIDLTGRRFGRLVVINYTNTRADGAIMWECMCDCGKKCLVKSVNLTHNLTRSCGCLKSEVAKVNARKEKYTASFNHLLLNYRENAKKRSIEFSIPVKIFMELTEKNCFYCGEPPNQVNNKVSKKTYGNYLHNGIDRLDSSLGYIVGNVVPCCKICNYAKRSMSQKQFLSWIEKVYNHSIK